MQPRPGLSRNLGLVGLTATGVCSMLGAAIYVIPFTIHRTVPDLGPHVLPAYLFAAIPAVLAALAYASLGTAMPRAGGSYVYASRSLGPLMGFVASFSQWFGLSIAIGVVSYLLVPFLRDAALTVGWNGIGAALDHGPARLMVAIAFLWTFVGVNIRGLTLYQRTLNPMMFLMFGLGAIVIVVGFSLDHGDFRAALAATEGVRLPATPPNPPLGLIPVLAASGLLFSTFIGFDSIAQAGGEAKNPERNLPLAVGLAIASVGGFYFLFTAAMYHAVPWTYIAEQAALRDLTAPGLLGMMLPPAATAAILLGAAVALINDLPAMLLAVSRMMFAWAGDGIFPRRVATVHPRFHTPWMAILLSGLMATAGILGSHFAGDVFLGIDILVVSMLVNFGLICVALVALPARSPQLAARITILSPGLRKLIGILGASILTLVLGFHVVRDLTGEVAAWYYRSTPVWLLVMGTAALVCLRELSVLRRAGADTEQRFRTLPEQ